MRRTPELLLALLSLALVAGTAAATPPRPNPGIANVNGNPSEWSNADFFTTLHLGNNPSRPVEARVYLRYDCEEGVLYSYVDVEGSAKIRTDDPTHENYLRIGATGKLVHDGSGDDGAPPDFRYVNPVGITADGFEASAILASGSYLLRVHIKIFDDSKDGYHTVDRRDVELVIECPTVSPGFCWLTAGGAKFREATGGPVHSWGGNVYPGCNPTSGEGGNWNHIAHKLDLHFQGRQIEVIRCGNVAGIPPGSESPRTPFNFIEFRGTGRLFGVGGNNADHPLVHFFARCEDRSEPGSNGQRDETFKDRYFLHVFSNPASPASSTLLLVDVDGDPTSVDPLTITDGNMQIHDSSCEEPTSAKLASPENGGTAGATALRFYGRGSEFALELPEAADVIVRVFDIAGRERATLAGGTRQAGEHRFALRGAGVPSLSNGVYFARAELRWAGGSEVRTARVVLIK